jgi:hypothetical protein
VTFPETIASHSTVQTYYFDSKTGLQRRMDYDVEVNGWANVAPTRPSTGPSAR